MRIALLSDVHGNLPAFEAVLADVDAAGRRGDLVPGRPGGLRRRARRLRGAGPRALRRLPGRQPRPRRDRRHRHRRLLRRAPRRPRAWTRENISAESLDVPARRSSPPTPTREIGLYHASPRDPVWEYVLSTWQADECMDLMEPRVGADRPLARGALVLPRRRGQAVEGAPRPGGTERDLSDGRVAAQPRRGGPAARRRPARGLAPARHRERGPRPGGAWSTRSTRPPRPSRRPGCPRVLGERLYSGQ